MKTFLVVSFILIVSVATAYFALQNPAIKETRMEPVGNIQLTSPVFTENGDIPDKYTCKGDNSSPPLEISGVPSGTASFALIVHDPDAPVGDFTHWLVWNISPATTHFAEKIVPPGAIQGKSGFGNNGYNAPCPPSGTHHYEFELYALKSKIDLPAGSSRAQLETAMKGQILAQTKLVGVVSAK